MLTSFSAFIPSSHSSQDLPPLGDDDELWEIFLKLVLDDRAKLTEILADTLNTSLLFAALFSAVNVGILALSLPTLTQDTICGGDPSTPSAHSNRIFASCLTLSLIAAFFSFMGKHWVTHYNNLGPTAHMENLKTLQRRLDGAIRWNFEGLVIVGLPMLLQFTLMAFILEWIAYLHWQGDRVSYPINGLSIFGGFLVVLMLGCASWDHWCPYQTPYTTTIPKAVGNWVLYCGEICVDIFKAFAYIRRPISGLKPRLSLGIFRREETDEVMDLKSLCWMLENAPRGPPLLRVARHISGICLRNPHGMKRIMASPHLFRLHEMFWYLLIKIKWTSRDNPANANGHIEMLEHLSILGSAIICTSPQWTDGLHPLPMSTMTEVFRVSFWSEKHGPKKGDILERYISISLSSSLLPG